MRAAALMCLASLLVAGGCVDEVDLPESSVAALFVDGAVVLDTDEQSLVIGQTIGLGVRFDGLDNLAVEVTDLTSGRRFRYEPRGGGRYTANFTGQRGHAYQLEVVSESGLRLVSAPDSLGNANFSLDGEAVVRQRIDRDGDPQGRNILEAEVKLERSGEVARDVVLLRPVFSWAYTDLVCGFLDTVRTCYVEERNVATPYVVVDLSEVGSEDTSTIRIGSEFINYRMAQSAYYLVEAERRSSAAQRYFLALNSALTQTASIFAERPQVPEGNLRSVGSARRQALGYFGVVDKTELVMPALFDEVKRRAGTRLCGDRNSRPSQVDCCFCNQSTLEGQLDTRPRYWP